MLIIIGIMALASSPLMPDEATPLMPALQSYWLWLHVSVTLFGEAFFAVAFVTSIMYLAADSREKKGMAKEGAISSEKLDSISYRCVAVGFPLFTLGGLVFGMVWAYRAWGSYWSWDIKETWTLVTWLFYTLLLHSRLLRGWRGRRMGWLALMGLGLVLFTFIGVGWLARRVGLESLHVY